MVITDKKIECVWGPLDGATVPDIGQKIHRHVPDMPAGEFLITAGGGAPIIHGHFFEYLRATWRATGEDVMICVDP